jgi:hypothetical protein
MKRINIPKRSLLSLAVSASLAAGLAVTSLSADAAPKKYLMVWTGDQVLDDGAYAQPDFLTVIDATPSSATYGKVVNTALMPAVLGQHLLAETENVVDSAVCFLAGTNCPGFLTPMTSPGTTGDTLDGLGVGGGVADALGMVFGAPKPIHIPSSILNEAHHINNKPRIDAATGHKYMYLGGLISSNVFGCDVTNPLHIKPTPGSTHSELDPLNPLGGSILAPATPVPTDNICGLAVGSTELTATAGTDDIGVLPSGNLLVTQMGYKGHFADAAPRNAGVIGAHTMALPNLAGVAGPGTPLASTTVLDGASVSYGTASPPTLPTSMPPTLQTPGGLLEFDYLGNVVGEHPSALPAGAVYPSGTLAGQRIAPNRYRARHYLAVGQPLTNGNEITNGDGTGIDTGPEAHPHGLGMRADLNSTSPYFGYYHGSVHDGSHMADAGAKQGIVMTSDYADPVSLAVSQGADTFENLGTTVRFYHMNDLAGGPYAVAQMPDGNRVEDKEMHEEPEGLMAMAMTNRSDHKGAFVASMCGGALYYSPDVTVAQPQFKLVYDSGACVGASVFIITKNDKYLIMPKAGIATSPASTGNGDLFNRDYVANAVQPGEHNRALLVFDISKLTGNGTGGSFPANHAVACDAAPASKWNNTGVPRPGDGAPSTVGVNPANGPHSENLKDGSGNNYWPNNDAADCPKVVASVNLDSPKNFSSHGGPHATWADAQEKYVATAQYFVDLRRYPVDGVWNVFGITPFNPFAASVTQTNLDSLGIKGWKFNGQTAGTPPDGTNNGLAGGSANWLPGTGSTGDNTVCMTKFNNVTGAMSLDPAFQDATTDGTNVKYGCISMERANWPHGATGNASPHALTFVETAN